ncbi:hypothetical protein, partial [uncultured Alistipes sp.]|uniref:hypothetical protein n=1 Tax=uncultured Alistipes sp. TaxID=538949 RepID=UPI0026189B7E
HKSGKKGNTRAGKKGTQEQEKREHKSGKKGNARAGEKGGKTKSRRSIRRDLPVVLQVFKSLNTGHVLCTRKGIWCEQV